MTKIEAKYYNFLHRFLINSGLIYAFIIAFILEIIIIANGEFGLRSIIMINGGFVAILILFVLKAYNETNQYLARVVIDDENFSFTIYHHDKELPTVVMPIDEIKVRLSQDFIARYRRYKLEIRIKNADSNLNYSLIHKQYPVGFWNVEELKNVLMLINEKQGISG